MGEFMKPPAGRPMVANHPCDDCERQLVELSEWFNADDPKAYRESLGIDPCEAADRWGLRTTRLCQFEESSPYLRVTEVASHAKVSGDTVIRWIEAVGDDKRLPAVNISTKDSRKNYRVLLSDLENFLENRRH